MAPTTRSADSLHEAWTRAGKVQGRRTTIARVPPLPLPCAPRGRGARGVTAWVEPGYLEPDASWCVPGGTPASPLANGGAFGGKIDSPVTDVARRLSDQQTELCVWCGRCEDVVRFGPS